MEKSSAVPSPTGYSGTPLIKKLGIREGHRLWLSGEPGDYGDLLGPLPEGARLAAEGEEVDFAHVFARTRDELAAGLAAARARIAPSGMVWVSWPKKASGVVTELDGGVVRAAGHAAGLVDIKVCAVDETWSGHRFVIRVADRGR